MIIMQLFIDSFSIERARLNPNGGADTLLLEGLVKGLISIFEPPNPNLLILSLINLPPRHRVIVGDIINQHLVP